MKLARGPHVGTAPGPVAAGPVVEGSVVGDAVVDDSVRLARSWAEPTGGRRRGRAERTAARLGALVADPDGLELAVRFVDDVARPLDRDVAAAGLARLGESLATGARFLGPVDRALVGLGARLAPVVPSIVVPAARARLRSLVGHLVADAGPGLDRHLDRGRSEGFGVNVNLLGEAVLGEDEAVARLERTIALVRRPSVDYVSVKVSSLVAQLVTWDLEGSRARVVDRLLPLFRAARDDGVFVNLDMEEYRDLALTVAAFTDLLGREELANVEAGIVLQAYLPDSLAALDELTEFARRRVAAGGARIKVRLVKGANLAMEEVESELHGWPLAAYGTKEETDATFLAALDRALTPERTRAVRIGCASHNLFHVAYAVQLARAREVAEALDVEMLRGMAPAEAAAVRDEIHRGPVGSPGSSRGSVVLYTPVVRDADFDVAISYLVRRLHENAAPQNFLHAMLAGPGADRLASQEASFRAALVRSRSIRPEDLRPRRATIDRTVPRPGAFRNARDSDPAVAVVRAWAREVVALPSVEVRRPRTPELTTADAVAEVVVRAVATAPAWAATAPARRAAVLRAAARRLEEARTDLVAAMVHEPGKSVAEADPEVSEAVDFAAYYADRADDLDAVPGARAAAGGVVLVAPPWNFPVAIPAGGVLAALAAGSPAILKPAPATPRCAEVVVDALRQALAECGVPGDVVQLARVADGDLGRRLVTHPGVARVVLTGSIETARMFARWRPELDVVAETSGKNALVITPSADPDLAVADLLRSAFGHAGQKCSAASLAILVGTAGDPGTAIGARIRDHLVSAVRSLAVGESTSLGTVMGPLTDPASGKLLDALTRLGQGERWLVEPHALDEQGRLWTPGLKEGVRPGSSFHRTECFGPVLGIMTADTLDEAIALQNAVDFGLTGGIHSLDDDEVDRWLARVEVGNAYVNRHTTGAIVRRQPFGGWKASTVGPGAKAGGPDYVAQLARWSDRTTEEGGPVPSRTTDPAAWLAWAQDDDRRVWAQDLSREHDPSSLRSEADLLRYRPVPGLTLRVGEGALEVEVERVLHAAGVAGVAVDLSHVRLEDDAAFAARVAAGGVHGRIRVVGSAAGLRAAAAARVGDVTVLDGPVLAAGRRELLGVVREQAVSRTRHRFGHVPPAGTARSGVRRS